MNQEKKRSVPVWYWIVAVLALLWNLMGCAAFGVELFAQEMAMEAWTEVQKEWARTTPNWIFFVYAVAVTTGVAGSIGLLMRKSWTVPAFAISLVAVIVQMLFSMIIYGGLQIMGPSSLFMPGLIIGLGAALLWFSWFAKGRNWFS